jgi:predicted patatin/cPLA2 family phospholipase
MASFAWVEKLHVGVPYHIILKYKNTMKTNSKYNKRKRTVSKNTKILEAVMATLESLTNTVHLKEMVMNDIQVHLLDEDGDGVILSLAYDENGELEKTFSSVDEFYEDTIEVELEDDAETALFDDDYYGGREDFTVTVLDEETEDEFLKYDLHKIDKPLLN